MDMLSWAAGRLYKYKSLKSTLFVQLVEEYLRGPDYNAVPQTFQMEALLNEMCRIDQHTDDHQKRPTYQGTLHQRLVK